MSHAAAYGALVALLLTAFLFFNLVHDQQFTTALRHGAGIWSPQPNAWAFDPSRDSRDYGLTLEQCDIAFPKLFKPIDDSVARWRWSGISSTDLQKDDWPPGTLRILIWDGQLYVIDAVKPHLRRSRIFSTLHAINRAIMSSSDTAKLPNIEAILSFEDFSVDTDRPVWAYDRKASDDKTWLMPDFGFYAWPEPGIGTYAEVKRKMAGVEARYASLSDKIQKLIWRGAISRGVAPGLRQRFVDVAANHSWADVEKLVWNEENDEQRHRIPIEDHCKYAFIAHTEGRAWSGRLKYVQNCKSVIVAHEQKWFQHHQHLLQDSGPEQNYVKVKRDFSDLPESMDFLLSNPQRAMKIAENSASTFRDRYLTPAAETCYWRKLIRGWAKVAFEPEFYTGEGPNKTWRGVPAESFSLMRKLEWEPS